MSWPEIEARTAHYYDRMTFRAALDAAREWVDEWDYETDPHGYCHLRPIVAALVAAASPDTETGTE